MQIKDIRLVKILMEKYNCAKITMFDFLFLVPFLALLFMSLLYADVLKYFNNSLVFFTAFVFSSLFIRRCKVIFRKRKDSTK